MGRARVLRAGAVRWRRCRAYTPGACLLALRCRQAHPLTAFPCTRHLRSSQVCGAEEGIECWRYLPACKAMGRGGGHGAGRPRISPPLSYGTGSGTEHPFHIPTLASISAFLPSRHAAFTALVCGLAAPRHPIKRPCMNLNAGSVLGQSPAQPRFLFALPPALHVWSTQLGKRSSTGRTQSNACKAGVRHAWAGMPRAAGAVQRGLRTCRSSSLSKGPHPGWPRAFTTGMG